jgi:hypothetical protein
MMLHGKVEGLAYNEFLKKNSIPAEVGPFALPPTPEIYHRIEPLLDRRFKEWKRTYKGTL